MKVATQILIAELSSLGVYQISEEHDISPVTVSEAKKMLFSLKHEMSVLVAIGFDREKLLEQYNFIASQIVEKMLADNLETPFHEFPIRQMKGSFAGEKNKQ